MPEEAEPPREVFLFLGAGASVCAGVPHTVSFLEEFERAHPSDLELKSTLAEIRVRILNANKAAGVPDPPDLESVLEAIALVQQGARYDIAPVGVTPADVTSDSSPYSRLKRELQAFIRERCLVKPEATVPLDGLRRILYDYDTIHVFTVNYDVVFELLAQRHGLPTIDGFQSTWAPTTFNQDPPKVCIYKLHGSAVWYRTRSAEFIRLPVRSTPDKLELLSGERPEPLMLYPAQKLEYSGPFLELLTRFQGCLKRAQWFVVVGYSFRDDHINEMLREAAAENRSLRLVTISPSAEKIYLEKLAKGEQSAAPANPESPEALFPSSLSGRVVRLPFKFEKVARDFADFWFDRIQSAINARDQARMDALYGKRVDWRAVAMNLAEAGVLDGLDELEDKRFSMSELDDLQRLLYSSSKAMVAASLEQWKTFENEWQRLLSMLRNDYLGGLSFQWHPGAPVPAFFIQFTRWSRGPTNVLLEYRAGASVAVGELIHARLQSKRYADYVRGSDHENPLCLMDQFLAQLQDFWELYNRGSATLDQFLLTVGQPGSKTQEDLRAKWKGSIEGWANKQRPGGGEMGEGDFGLVAKEILEMERGRLERIFSNHVEALSKLSPEAGWKVTRQHSQSGETLSA